jgi:hypothetical protein
MEELALVAMVLSDGRGLLHVQVSRPFLSRDGPRSHDLGVSQLKLPSIAWPAIHRLWLDTCIWYDDMAVLGVAK